MQQNRLGDLAIVGEIARRLQALADERVVIVLDRLEGVSAPSDTARISRTMSSGNSARLILRPNRATRAPYFCA